MRIADIFSLRQKNESENNNDIYTYDNLPKELRTQIIYIWREALGGSDEYFSHRANVKCIYEILVSTLRKEYGMFRLVDKKYNLAYQDNYLNELEKFFLNEIDIHRALDVVELTFRAIDKFTRDFHYLYKDNGSEIADNAIQELNDRFKLNKIGYRFESGQIIKIDSTFTHQEMIKPALKLLQDPAFAGAEDEFLKAHDYYRKNDPKGCISECLKAFESTMKIICSEKGWTYPPSATASKLIDICFENKLIPNFWQSYFSGIRTTLESGVPTGRNRTSSHGQGQKILEVPVYMASSIINMTATGILLLVSASKEFNNSLSNAPLDQQE